ncbi:MAG: tetratricopeptide repeat protein [Candidatus Marinimicrobia bacterium]|nr:tetratricopeptide repeat protein [Candidatus Neomarinimicrobiota bacterium]
MLRLLRNNLPLTLLFALILFGCTSQELTSAKLYIQQQNWDKAEEYLLAALKVEPQNPEIPFLLGDEIYKRNQDWDNMNKMFDLALELGPDKPIKDGATVQEYVKTSRSLAWEDAYNNVAVKQFNTVRGKEGDDKNQALDLTIEAFEMARKIFPLEPQTYPILSQVYISRGLNDKALEILETVKTLKVEDPRLFVTMGKAYSRLGKPSEARDALENALNLDASNLDAIKFLAQIYYDLGQIENAVEAYEKAIELEENEQGKADLHFNLGLLYMKMGKTQKAEENFMDSYDLNPDDTEVIIGIAQTYEEVENWRRAEKWYKEAIFLEPDNPTHYRRIAIVLINQGLPDEANRYLEKSKKLSNP